MEKCNPNYYMNANDDSEMIQSAVDEAAKTGAAVTIPRRNQRTGKDIWEIARAIQLHTSSVVYLDNCHLRQADGVYQNIFRNSNNGAEIGKTREGRQYDIRICGRGNAVLDGGKRNGLTEYTHNKNGLPRVTENSTFYFVNTERVVIENLRIVNQRYHAINFYYSMHVRISNIDFYAPRTTINQDGIDLRTGCSHFLIENITGCTGDDTVALTCLQYYLDEDMKKAGFDDSIHNVIIRNIHTCTPYGLVRLLNHGGKKLYNVLIENIMEAVEIDPADPAASNYKPLNPETYDFRAGSCVRIGENRYYKEGAKAKLGDTYNITVRNVCVRGRMGVRANCALSQALIENVKVFGDGGTAVYFGEGVMRNIHVRDISYTIDNAPRDTDDNLAEGSLNFIVNPKVNPNREICAVYFKETDADNLTFQNINAGDNLTAVFGGHGKVRLTASNVTRYNSKTPLVSGNGIDAEIV